MRPMDQNDNPPNSSNKSNQSSPVPSPPPPATSSTSIPNIRVNSILRLTTIYDVTRTGKVVAYDPSLNLVTLHIKGTKSGLTSIAVINLNQCREYTVEQEPKDDTLESLYPIDLSKIKKRVIENEAEKKREASSVNIKATRIGQTLFRDLKKTMNQVIRWSNNDILINNTVRIVEPYRSENVSIDASSTTNKNSAKGDNDTKTHIMKLVDKFWLDQSKTTTTSNSDSTRTTVVDHSESSVS